MPKAIRTESIKKCGAAKTFRSFSSYQRINCPTLFDALLYGTTILRIEDKSGQDAFNTLWECWMTKFNVATKNGLVAYALEKYGQEKREALESAYAIHKLMKSGRL